MQLYKKMKLQAFCCLFYIQGRSSVHVAERHPWELLRGRVLDALTVVGVEQLSNGNCLLNTVYLYIYIYSVRVFGFMKE